MCIQFTENERSSLKIPPSVIETPVKKQKLTSVLMKLCQLIFLLFYSGNKGNPFFHQVITYGSIKTNYYVYKSIIIFLPVISKCLNVTIPTKPGS